MFDISEESREFKFPLNTENEKNDFRKYHQLCTDYTLCKDHNLALIEGRQVTLYSDVRNENVMFLTCFCYFDVKSGYRCKTCGRM
jgi:hypothetical protein